MDTIVSEVIERFASRVHAYVWMTNHIHLWIQVADTPLGRLMLRIASQYARRVQKRFKTTGHLFECRYHALLVDADEYLLELIRYIHLNPVRARMVEATAQYEWSSHHVYAGTREQPWVTTQFALSLFHSDALRARTSYLAFVNEHIDRSVDPSAAPTNEVNEHDVRVLGGDEFVGAMLGASWKPIPRRAIEAIIAEACEKFGLSKEEICRQGRQRKPAYVRAWIAREALACRAASLNRVAALFGRDESTLRESLERHFGR